MDRALSTSCPEYDSLLPSICRAVQAENGPAEQSHFVLCLLLTIHDNILLELLDLYCYTVNNFFKITIWLTRRQSDHKRILNISKFTENHLILFKKHTMFIQFAKRRVYTVIDTAWIGPVTIFSRWWYRALLRAVKFRSIKVPVHRKEKNRQSSGSFVATYFQLAACSIKAYFHYGCTLRCVASDATQRNVQPYNESLNA